MECSSCASAHRSLRRKAERADAGGLSAASLALLEECSSPPPSGALLACISFDTVTRLLGEGAQWEMVALGLLILMASCDNVSPRLPALPLPGHMDVLIEAGQLNPLLLRLLEHSEPRVRVLCVAVLSAMCDRLGFARLRLEEEQLPLYNQLGPCILQQIACKFVRSSQSQAAVSGPEATIPLDDTTGWSSLESSMMAYYALVKEGGAGLLLHLFQDESVVDLLISKAGRHQNRFVREATITFIGECCLLIATQRDDEPRMTKEWSLSSLMAAVLKPGLEDNWSRIRQASCMSSLSFLSTLQGDEDRIAFFPTLLPSICLNRFYAAEGVKSAALKTWRSLVGIKGREYVERFVEPFLTHYSEMSKANNHMISEAACSATAEILSRIDRGAVLPHVPLVAQALGACLGDASWPVRDASCVAAGSLLRYYGQEVSSATCQLFLEVASTHLKDAIWSLRENAAIAICETMKTDDAGLQERLVQFTLDYLTENLDLAHRRPPPKGRVITFLSDKQAAALEASAGQARRPGEPTATVGPSVWRQGGGWGCCLDCMETRQGDAYDTSSGALYLLREFAGTPPFAVQACSHLAKLWPLLDSGAGAAEAEAKKEKLQMSVLKEVPEILTRLCAASLSAAAAASWREHRSTVQALASGSSNRALSACAEDCLAACAAQLPTA